MDMIITIEETEEKDSSLFPHYKYPFEKFNVVQSTVFEHYQSSNNFIIASATNSGKTVMAEFFLFDALIEKKKKLFTCVLLNLLPLKSILLGLMILILSIRAKLDLCLGMKKKHIAAILS